MVSPSLVRLPRNVHFLQILFVEYYFHATLYCSEYKDNKLSTIIHYKSGKIVSKRTKPRQSPRRRLFSYLTFQ